MDREQGITYPRLYAMLSNHKRMKRVDLHSLGMATALAFHDPGKLADLAPDSKKVIDPDTLPAMLRAPKNHG